MVSAPAIIPQPVSIEAGQGQFELRASTALTFSDQFPNTPAAVAMLLGAATGFAFAVAAVPSDAAMRVHCDASMPAEGYRLHVDTDSTTITAATEAGVFYALQTLRQLLPASIDGSVVDDAQWILPTVDIVDRPRFGWRGMHLDVARHFMPVAFIKKYIDLLAMYKMNRFHWHLTDDQGWRLEIKRYPLLTEVGSRRAQTVVGRGLFTRPENRQYDGAPHSGFYTQEDVREIVAYAKARQVMVIPEIEFPGHAQAAIAAYPELGNSDEPLTVKQEWGVSRRTLNPSEETLAFYRNVLSEVMSLFPAPYLHIGGDEAPKDQWQSSKFAQERMRELGLPDEKALQSWMVAQMSAFVTAHGRQLVGWDEIMQGGLPDSTVVMSWRGMSPGIAAAKAGHDVVMAPTRWTYFDYYQADAAGEPLAIGAYLPLRDVYWFDAAPSSLEASVRQRILGGQAQVWTEFMKTPEQVEYMAYPRALALSEALWTPQSSLNYAGFERRLAVHLPRLDVFGVNYRPPGNDRLSLRGWLQQWTWRPLMVLYRWYSDL